MIITTVIDENESLNHKRNYFVELNFEYFVFGINFVTRKMQSLFFADLAVTSSNYSCNKNQIPPKSKEVQFQRLLFKK